MMDGDWRQKFGGKMWRMTEDGCVEVEGEGILRTNGEPVTMQTFRGDYMPAVEAVQERLCAHGIAPDPSIHPYLATITALEATRLGDSYHRDPQAIRLEPDYESDASTPDQVSPGLTQTLISTAETVVERHGLWSGGVAREDLFIPYRSLLVAGFYLADLASRYQWDPIILSAAYNAGGVYESDDNAFRLRVYDEERPRDTARWWNDWIAVQEE